MNFLMLPQSDKVTNYAIHLKENVYSKQRSASSTLHRHHRSTCWILPIFAEQKADFSFRSVSVLFSSCKVVVAMY